MATLSWDCTSAASFDGAHTLQVSGVHMACSLVAFEFVSLDLVGVSLRECDNYFTSTVLRFEYSITNLRENYDTVERR